MLKKITSRIYGEAAQNLLKSMFLFLKRRDRLSFQLFKCYAGTYFMGRFSATPLPTDAILWYIAEKYAGNRTTEESIQLGKYLFYGRNEPIPDFLEIVNDSEKLVSAEDVKFFEAIFTWFEGPYETGNVKLKDNDIVIDAGANMGIFSVLAADRGATVYAFEPQPPAQKILEANVALNNFEEKIHIVKLGLSDSACEVEFFEDETNLGGAGIVARDGRKGKTYKINCISLDEWVAQNNIPRVDFIKVDIEGAERLMLKGAKETLKKCKPRLALCTYHLPDDPEVMKNLILAANPEYKIDQRDKKLYAW